MRGMLTLAGTRMAGLEDVRLMSGHRLSGRYQAAKVVNIAALLARERTIQWLIETNAKLRERIDFVQRMVPRRDRLGVGSRARRD